MNSEEVQKLIQSEIERYRYIKPTGTLGTPWPEEKMLGQVESLKRDLIPPKRHPFTNGQSYWTITQRDANGYIVFFDDSTAEFGLAVLAGDETLEDINVRGDLVGTYAAR